MMLLSCTMIPHGYVIRKLSPDGAMFCTPCRESPARPRRGVQTARSRAGQAGSYSGRPDSHILLAASRHFAPLPKGRTHEPQTPARPADEAFGRYGFESFSGLG